MLVFVCVLAALGGARADIDACAGARPVTISADAGGLKNYYPVDKNYLFAMYGRSVNVFCSGIQANYLTISMDGVRQATNTIDTTTVKLTLTKLEMKDYVVNCTDMETMCNETLMILIGAEVAVVSKNVKQKQLFWYMGFYVPINEDYELVCCGSQADSLQITHSATEKPDRLVKSGVVNETCIKSIIIHNAEIGVFLYSCKILPNVSNVIDTAVRVFVDSPPAAINFWCIEYAMRAKCSWSDTRSELEITYNLVSLDENGNSMRVCEDLTNKETRFCEWSIFHAQMRGVFVKERLHFVLQSCNIISCSNETYNIDRDTIRKSKSPLKLKPLRIGSYSAQLQWSGYYGDKAKYYKIKYSLAGTEWLEVDSSSIHNNDTMGIPYYSVDLTLPCSDSLYAVKVYARYAATPLSNDAYWSDPASMSFYTEPRGNSTVEEDPMCNTEKELLTFTDSAAAYAVKLLKKDVRKDGVKLHKHVKTLRQKLAGLEELRRTEL